MIMVIKKKKSTKPRIKTRKRQYKDRYEEMSSPEWWAFSVMSDLQEALYMGLPQPRLNLYINQIKQIIKGKYYTDGFTLQLVPQGQRQASKSLEAEGFIYGEDVYGISEEGVKAINKIDNELKPLVTNGYNEEAIRKINEIKRVLSPPTQKSRTARTKRKPRVFKSGRSNAPRGNPNCNHEFREIPQYECQQRGIKQWEMYDHVYECIKCGYRMSVDSSD